jgi:hypothetical protein
MPVYGARADAFNQGDIFADVPFLEAYGESTYGTVKSTYGIVISHDCDLDKYLKPSVPLTPEESSAWRITMALVHPLSDLSADRQGNVRADNMPRFFFLPAEDDLADLCVDLWTEQPVAMEGLLECKRVASLSPETRVLLWWKMIRLRLGQHYRAILEGNVPPDAA